MKFLPSEIIEIVFLKSCCNDSLDDTKVCRAGLALTVIDIDFARRGEPNSSTLLHHRGIYDL